MRRQTIQTAVIYGLVILDTFEHLSCLLSWLCGNEYRAERWLQQLSLVVFNLCTLIHSLFTCTRLKRCLLKTRIWTCSSVPCLLAICQVCNLRSYSYWTHQVQVALDILISFDISVSETLLKPYGNQTETILPLSFTLLMGYLRESFIDRGVSRFGLFHDVNVSRET